MATPTPNENRTDLNSQRESVLESGKQLSKAIVPRGEQGFGTISELQLNGLWNASVIVGIYGYLGIIDYGSKKIFDFQDGCGACRVSFDQVYRPYESLDQFTIESVENTMFMGSGDDSAVIQMLLDYQVPDSVEQAFSGTYEPTVYLRTRGETERQRDARKFFGRSDDEQSTSPLAAGLLRVAAAKELGIVESSNINPGQELPWSECMVLYEQQKS